MKSFVINAAWALILTVASCLTIYIVVGACNQVRDAKAELARTRAEYYGPIAIGGDERTPCDQDDHCRVEHDGKGDMTVIECKEHAPEPIVFDAEDVVIKIDDTAPEGLVIIDTDSGGDPNGLIWSTDIAVSAWSISECSDITFGYGNTSVLFEWGDGKFDVVYDANDITGAAEAFFVAMKPYLNAHIKDAAKNLNRRNQ